MGKLYDFVDDLRDKNVAIAVDLVIPIDVFGVEQVDIPNAL